MTRTRIVSLALVGVLVLAARAQAQDTVLISVARKQISGVNDITGASPITAAMVPTGQEVVVLLADLSDADRQDPTKTFWVRMFESTDNGLTWKGVVAFQFIGDPSIAPGTPVGVYVPVVTGNYTLVGSLIRIELDVPNRMALGGSVTITTSPPF